MRPRKMLLTGAGLVGATALAFAGSALATSSATRSGASAAGNPAHTQHVSLTIINDRVVPATGGIAIAPGVPVRVTVWNHTREYHTITIPGLHVSALILPAHEGSARKTTFTFTAYRFGVFSWYCTFCKHGLHGHHHAMTGKIYAIISVEP
jgi:hypothetical protein